MNTKLGMCLKVIAVCALKHVIHSTITRCSWHPQLFVYLLFTFFLFLLFVSFTLCFWVCFGGEGGYVYVTSVEGRREFSLGATFASQLQGIGT
jgi:hypothetical protein